MALAYVASSADARVSGVNTSTGSRTYANAACLSVVTALIVNTGGSTVTISDASGTYSSSANTAPDANSQAWIKYFPNHNSGAHTITVDPAGSSADVEFWMTEVTGAATSSVLDADSGQATGAISSGVGGTMTFTTASALDQAANFVVAVGTHTASDKTLTTGTIGGSAATFIAENESNSGGQCGHLEYRIIASASALTSTVTYGSEVGNGTWGIAVAIFKEAAAGGGVKNPSTLTLTGVQ